MIFCFQFDLADMGGIHPEGPGDFLGGEDSLAEEGSDDPVLLLPDSLLNSLLETLLESLLHSFLNRFLEQLIDDIGGHAFLPEDGDKSPFHVLRTGDAVIACEIGEFRLQYAIGGLLLSDLLQEDPETPVQVVEDVLQGQESENGREVFQALPDLPVVDEATSIMEREKSGHDGARIVGGRRIPESLSGRVQGAFP